MFMDSSIPIPPNTPPFLKERLDYLQELYDSTDKNHDLLWDNYWESVESKIKQAHLSGKLSRKDAIQLFNRYGLYD